MKRLLIVTDTTSKQTNGVVRTLTTTAKIASNSLAVHWISPEDFTTVALPIYKEIDISLSTFTIGKKIAAINPDYIHIATEGPVGLAAKLYCDYKNYKYTSSYHSMFPEFIESMISIPARVTYPYFKWFHSRSSAVLVPTEQVKTALERKQFKNLTVWSRGVDKNLFSSSYKNAIHSGPKIILCVSRVSKEKGLDDFCEFEINDGYVKVLVGDGPYLAELKKKYQTAPIIFAGKHQGVRLASYYANATVFVFPSRNDTFGLTQLESIASGTPVIAYKATASEEIVSDQINGILVDQLTMQAVKQAEKLNRQEVENSSAAFTWESVTEVFLTSLVSK